MAKTSFISIVPELREKYFRNLQSSDRLVMPRIRKKIPMLSLSRRRGLRRRSLLPQISEIWKNFSAAEKLAWNQAAAVIRMRGFNLFVQDQALRIKNNFPGVAIPSLLHQTHVGVLQIDAPADELQIVQLHPRTYWVLRRVRGKKGMFEPVLVTENLRLPLKISLSYRAELEPTGIAVAWGYGVGLYGEAFYGADKDIDSSAKFCARVWHSYQGRDLTTEIEVPLDFLTDWKTAEKTLNAVAGYIVGYDLYFFLRGLRGTLYIDNVKAEHSGQNWVRDSVCRDINQGFTRAFFQIPRHWAGIYVPAGTWFESFYINW